MKLMAVVLFTLSFTAFSSEYCDKTTNSLELDLKRRMNGDKNLKRSDLQVETILDCQGLIKGAKATDVGARINICMLKVNNNSGKKTFLTQTFGKNYVYVAAENPGHFGIMDDTKVKFSGVYSKKIDSVKKVKIKKSSIKLAQKQRPPKFLAKFWKDVFAVRYSDYKSDKIISVDLKTKTVRLEFSDSRFNKKEKNSHLDTIITCQ